MIYVGKSRDNLLVTTLVPGGSQKGRYWWYQPDTHVGMIANDDVAVDYDSDVVLDDQNVAEDGEVAPNTSVEVSSVNGDKEQPYMGNIDPATVIPDWC